MDISIIRILLDFGLVVLIWIIQRIVYPGFLYFRTDDLVVWHRVYTARFSTIVMPLMLGQLGIAIYQLVINANLYTGVSLVIILLIWLTTFLQFTPIHSTISKQSISEDMLVVLIKKNWMRTVLWTLLFLLTITYYTFFG